MEKIKKLTEIGEIEGVEYRYEFEKPIICYDFPTLYKSSERISNKKY